MGVTSQEVFVKYREKRKKDDIMKGIKKGEEKCIKWKRCKDIKAIQKLPLLD